ncbi:phage holin family protein [Flavobacterium haoranii]|uniref:Putative membrane protein n=1 Tax=Flavobacterium haoranii TaxID=683124 RepID=A0A1M6FXB1_9FLAO|nr:phage holin family protein [Flavobacterium haoranii]MDK2771980.1 phage holin family protein [Flavobacterium sp.]SHJ02358.1 putative membrane protein [Flavobacterium haoranii]
MNLLIKLLITTVLIVVIAHFFPGISVDNFSTALIVAVVLGLLNVFIKPILVLFTIPATILTLGLFLLVINAVIIMLADYFVDGFHVNGFWIAFLFSIVLSVFQSVLNKILVDEK